MIQTLQATIHEAIQQYGFRRLLLAVSGGLDSICLAHYFIANKEALGIEWLGIAHVHHGLREGTADRDAEFVRNFAEKCNVPFFLKKLDGASLKASEGSLEENARNARYAALTQFACENKVHAIVTAHHAGDQAETMFLRLHRGVTLAGLHGMQQIREFSRSSIIYRPFLSITREQLHEYAIQNNLTWCEDESNCDTKFARNQIRHEALPALESDCPGATEQLCRIATLADSAYSKIILTAENLFAASVIPPEKWPFEASLSPYRKVIALDETTLQKTLDALGQAMTSPAQSQGLQEIFRLWLDSRGFRFPTGAPVLANFRYRTRSIEKCRHIIWIYDTRENQAPSNLYFSDEKQRFSGIPGLWRHPQDGDILSPMDMKIKARKLATWLQEKGIPHWIREFLQVYAQGSMVLFVSGIRNKFDK